MLAKKIAALLLGVLALAADAAKTSNNTMSLGDGNTVTTNSTTTIFLGSEYHPNKCLLQFGSLKCKNNKECGEINGYQLECNKLGQQDGVLKTQCMCPKNQTEVCQNTTNPLKGGVPQFGDCSDGKQCIDSYGHVPTKLELRICAEKMHCVKEINTTATVPAEICHTCRSCIAQNNAGNTTLDDKRRFDCTTICPPEILDSIAKRNQQGVGIADDINSTPGSGSTGSTSGSDENASSASGSNAASKQGAAVGSLFSATTLVASILLTSLAITAN